MKLPEPLEKGVLIRRYKRFLADVRLDDGREVTAHCPNTGSMKGCQPEGGRVWLSVSDNPERKLPYTWELVEADTGQLALINTARPNAQAREAVASGRIPELADYPVCRAEVRYGEEKSRIDLHLSGHGEQPDAWVEVKNVTLCEDGIGYFPDAVTTRGQKHLRELMAMVRQGERAVLLFVVNHSAVREVRPADHIDPEYGRLLRQADKAGVALLAWQSGLGVEPGGGYGTLSLVQPLPVFLG